MYLTTSLLTTTMTSMTRQFVKRLRSMMIDDTRFKMSDLSNLECQSVSEDGIQVWVPFQIHSKTYFMRGATIRKGSDWSLQWRVELWRRKLVKQLPCFALLETGRKFGQNWSELNGRWHQQWITTGRKRSWTHHFKWRRNEHVDSGNGMLLYGTQVWKPPLIHACFKRCFWPCG